MPITPNNPRNRSTIDDETWKRLSAKQRGDPARPRPTLHLYWDDPERLHAHWIIRSGARVDTAFAGIDKTFRVWRPSQAHLKVRSQAFEWWSNYDSSGEKIVQVPYLLRAVSGTAIDVAMEALCTLHEHLYHQDTVAGGVSLILPVLAELSSTGLTQLIGSVNAFLCLAALPHVREILPGFTRLAAGPHEGRRVIYRAPEWGVLPNEVERIENIFEGNLHGRCETFTERVVLDHQQPFCDRSQVSRQNELQVDGGFLEIYTYDHGAKSGPAEIRAGDVVVERGDLAAGGRQDRGKRVGAWAGAWPDGSPRFTADYVDGKREGIVRTFSSCSAPLTECEYRKNQRHGRWLQWSPDGTLVAKGQFARNRPCGTWNGFYPGGDPRFEGGYRDGLRFGPWRYWNRDGALEVRTHDYE